MVIKYVWMVFNLLVINSLFNGQLLAKSSNTKDIYAHKINWYRQSLINEGQKAINAFLEQNQYMLSVDIDFDNVSYQKSQNTYQSIEDDFLLNLPLSLPSLPEKSEVYQYNPFDILPFVKSHRVELLLDTSAKDIIPIGTLQLLLKNSLGVNLERDTIKIDTINLTNSKILENQGFLEQFFSEKGNFKSLGLFILGVFALMVLLLMTDRLIFYQLRSGADAVYPIINQLVNSVKSISEKNPIVVNSSPSILVPPPPPSPPPLPNHFELQSPIVESPVFKVDMDKKTISAEVRDSLFDSFNSIKRKNPSTYRSVLNRLFKSEEGLYDLHCLVELVGDRSVELLEPFAYQDVLNLKNYSLSQTHEYLDTDIEQRTRKLLTRISLEASLESHELFSKPDWEQIHEMDDKQVIQLCYEMSLPTVAYMLSLFSPKRTADILNQVKSEHTALILEQFAMNFKSTVTATELEKSIQKVVTAPKGFSPEPALYVSEVMLDLDDSHREKTIKKINNYREFSANLKSHYHDISEISMLSSGMIYRILNVYSVKEIASLVYGLPELEALTFINVFTESTQKQIAEEIESIHKEPNQRQINLDIAEQMQHKLRLRVKTMCDMGLIIFEKLPAKMSDNDVVLSVS